MVDASTEIVPHEAHDVIALPDKAAMDVSVPAAPADDRRARADDDRSWNAAVSEGWPSSPPHRIPLRTSR